MHSSRLRTAHSFTVSRNIRWGAVQPLWRQTPLDADSPGCRTPLNADPPPQEADSPGGRSPLDADPPPCVARKPPPRPITFLFMQFGVIFGQLRLAQSLLWNPGYATEVYACLKLYLYRTCCNQLLGSLIFSFGNKNNSRIEIKEHKQTPFF